MVIIETHFECFKKHHFLHPILVIVVFIVLFAGKEGKEYQDGEEGCGDQGVTWCRLDLRQVIFKDGFKNRRGVRHVGNIGEVDV